MKKQSRRKFFRNTSLSVASLSFLNLNVFSANNVKTSANINSTIDIGVASYSFRKFSFEELISAMKLLKIKYLSLKSMHLPLDLSDEEIRTRISEIKNNGLIPYSAGVVYMKNKEEVDNAFRYSKAAGFKIIVGVPNYELLDYVEKKVKEYDIIVAIHNHGPDNISYPSPDEILTRVRNRDKRLGMCMDVAHVARAGLNPVEEIIKSKDRLYDVHLRDITESAKAGKACRPGTGTFDLTGINKTLKEVGYSGVYSIEYEAEANDPSVGIAETAGYLKGIYATFNGL